MLAYLEESSAGQSSKIAFLKFQCRPMLLLKAALVKLKLISEIKLYFFVWKWSVEELTFETILMEDRD